MIQTNNALLTKEDFAQRDDLPSGYWMHTAHSIGR